MFHIFLYKWKFLNSKIQNLSRGMFLWRALLNFYDAFCLNKFFQISENKNTEHLATHYYVNNDYAMLKSLQSLHIIVFDVEQAENTKSSERQKTTFSKESIENVDFHISVLNKTMARHK